MDLLRDILLHNLRYGPLPSRELVVHRYQGVKEFRRLARAARDHARKSPPGVGRQVVAAKLTNSDEYSEPTAALHEGYVPLSASTTEKSGHGLFVVTELECSPMTTG